MQWEGKQILKSEHLLKCLASIRWLFCCCYFLPALPSKNLPLKRTVLHHSRLPLTNIPLMSSSFYGLLGFSASGYISDE